MSGNQYICKDCGHPINGNYVSVHFHCTDVHPDDRQIPDDIRKFPIQFRERNREANSHVNWKLVDEMFGHTKMKQKYFSATIRPLKYPLKTRIKNWFRSWVKPICKVCGATLFPEIKQHRICELCAQRCLHMKLK